ncbi:MAG: hypothetical protein RMK01_10235 [Thermomicrobium sp.]|nr:hypothetical protein [Thermomicrobium sp.]
MLVSEWLLIGAAGALAAGSVTGRRRRTSRLQRILRSFHYPQRRPHVVVLSASIGGGHNAAATVLREELETRGCHVTVLDGFAYATPLLSRYFQWSYPVQLRYAPWLYDWQFRSSHLRSWTRLWRRLYNGFAADALERLLEALEPDLVVSTYPLVTQVLGTLRLEGRLRVPAVAVITDYGVHRLWTAPGIDLHLVPSSVSAGQVEDATGLVQVMQPLVRQAFREPVDRARVRARFGFAPEEFVALVVAGAWGIGRVETIVRDVAACGVRTVVVCGRNETLANRLRRDYAGHDAVQVIGWTDEIPELMAAADCLVQNAGGLTCLEAIARRLPILLYRPIAGHGVFNAATMERAGVARWMRTPEELRAVLGAAASGQLQLPPPRIEHGAVPAAEAILSWVADRSGGDERSGGPVRLPVGAGRDRRDRRDA